MKNKYFYSELVALIKSGKSPEEALEIATSNIGNAEKLVARIKKEREAENKFNSNLNYFTGEIMALIKSGKTPEQAVQIATSHIGNVDKVKDEISSENHNKTI